MYFCLRHKCDTKIQKEDGLDQELRDLRLAPGMNCAAATRSLLFLEERLQQLCQETLNELLQINRRWLHHYKKGQRAIELDQIFTNC